MQNYKEILNCAMCIIISLLGFFNISGELSQTNQGGPESVCSNTKIFDILLTADKLLGTQLNILLINRVHEQETDSHFPGDFTFESDRPLRGFTIWFALNLHGVNKLKTHIREKLDLTTYCYKELAAIPGVEMAPYPQSLVVCFKLQGILFAFKANIFSRRHTLT